MIGADHTGDGKRATSNTAGGLESRAFLCIGAKVLTSKNVWQRVGLCNGATGNVIDIIYNPDVPPPGLPECVIVDFGDAYRAFVLSRVCTRFYRN